MNFDDDDYEGGGSDYDFLRDMEKTIEFKGDMTDFEWDVRNRTWDEQRAKIMDNMLLNNIWNMMPRHANEDEEEGEQEEQNAGPSVASNLGGFASTVAPPETLPSRSSRSNKTSAAFNRSSSSAPTKTSKLTSRSAPASSAMTNVSRIIWKVPKMSQLELFKYLQNWDKSSYGKRDRIIMNFIHSYETKDHVYDTDTVFCNGGSLIFARFVVGLHICFLKHRKVWHYYDACGIFVRSLQSDRYTEEFLRLGGLNYIIQVVRVEESLEIDKLRACHFLLNMMKGRNGHAVKQFICETAHILEALVDSLTMCKNKELIKSCGQIFENLCIEIPPINVPVICGYVMHALPCDFNPMLQSMAFKVLQNFVRLKPSLAEKCIKPILDNLRTSESELLVSMSNLSLVILQTKYGGDLISSLMIAAEGIHLREVFKTVFQSHTQDSRTMSTRELTDDMKRVREKREKVRLKQLRYDQYMHQAGALFVLNQMMTHKVDFVNDFVNKGVFGLSLKTLGSCPHWEVQGQGVTMVKFLFSVSMDCALSYYMMLPPRMLELIMSKPEECLRYFTSPICVYLRKLGRFALKMWNRWVEKVVVVARLYAKGSKIPPEVFKLTQMARKVHEIHQAMADLLDSPVMEAAPKTPDEEISEADREFNDFCDSSDEENMGQYKDGREVIMGDDRFDAFRNYLEDSEEFYISEDRLDIRVDGDTPNVLGMDDEDKELSAYQTAMLEDVEKTEKTRLSTTTDGDGQDQEGEDDAADDGDANDPDVQNQTVNDLISKPTM